jgi:ABC-type multidrug transport system fused ATPase/permease subunit
MTGREWLQIYRYINHKTYFLATCALSMLSGSVDYLFPVVQGRFATALRQSGYETPDEFMSTINSVCAKILTVTILMSVIRLVSGWFDSHCLPYFRHDLKLSLMAPLFAQDIGSFDEQHTDVILSRIK